MLSVSNKGRINWTQAAQSLVIHRNSFDGALIDTDTAVGAETRINNGLIVALYGLGGTNINASLAACAGIGVNFCWHFSTSLAGNPVLETTFSHKHSPGIG